MKINHIANLIKYKLSLAICFSACVGYIMYSKELNNKLLFLLLGVFFLSGGAAALNQYQEKEIDSKMDRTKKRPLPNEDIEPNEAKIIIINFILLGIVFLLNFELTVLFLGLFNILLYNFIYTKLKTKTYYAILVGALVGAIPPLMGWCAAGGYILSTTIIIVSSFVVLWQIPHFFLLSIKYKEEYDKAGLATVNKIFSEHQIKRLIFNWMLITSIHNLLFYLFDIITNSLYLSLLLLINIISIILFYKFAFKANSKNILRVFVFTNLFLVFVFTLIIVNSIIAKP